MTGKLRGGRRYFERRRREADDIVALAQTGEPVDLWHHHFDFKGYGERSPRLRMAHRRLALETFVRARAAAAVSGRPSQVFVQLAAPDTCGEDALYLHTQLDGPTGFPYVYPAFRWGATAPLHVREVVTGLDVRIGYANHDGADIWVVVDRDDPGLPV